MKKENVWKQALALVMSAALVLGNVSPVSAATGDVTAGTTGATTEGTAGDSSSVSNQDAYKELKFDFEDGQREVSGDNATYTENGISFTGSKSIEVVDAPVVSGDDAQRGKALKFSAKRAATNGASEEVVTGTTSLTTAQEALSKYDFSNGVTFSMDIFPNEDQSDWGYLFGLGTFNDEGHYVTGTLGFIASFGAPWEPLFPHNAWQDNNSVNSNYMYLCKNLNKWYHLDYVYTADGLTIKVDGVPAVAYRPEKEKMQTILQNLSKGQLRLAQGPDLKNEGFLGYMDNVTITPVAPHQHTYTDADIISETQATCTTPGTATVRCSTCGGTVTVERSPALGHAYTHIPEKAATCTEAGNRDHYKCSRCYGYFVSGDDGVQSSTKKDVTLPAAGHDYADPVTTKATATTDGKTTKTCKNCAEGTTGHSVTEVIAKASNITLEKTSYTYTGKAITPKVTVKDRANNVIDAANYTITYKNNIKAGKATAVITFKGDKYAGVVNREFTITAAVSLTLNKSSVTLYTGKASKTITVKATVKGTSQKVTWKTSNKKVAKVDSKGKITAVGKGTANVTATVNGIKKTVKVTVKNPTITVKNGKKAVKNKKTVTVKKKKSVKLTVSEKPKKSGVTVKKLSKKDAKIASVTYKKGKLTIKGKKKGTVSVKITSGKTTFTIKVKVK